MNRILRPEDFPPHSHERQLVQEVINQHGEELGSDFLVAIGFTPEQLIADALTDDPETHCRVCGNDTATEKCCGQTLNLERTNER